MVGGFAQRLQNALLRHTFFTQPLVGLAQLVGAECQAAGT